MAELVLNNTVNNAAELIGSAASNGIVFTGEMVEHVESYVDYVKSHGVQYWVEKKITIPDTPVTGICDGSAFSFDHIHGVLYIDDFKYGKGPVEVFMNWQLVCYAIGLLFDLSAKGYTINRVVMTIFQPRGYHHDGCIREWIISRDELNELYKQVYVAAHKAVSDDRQAVTGSHCRYCKGMSFCAAAKAAGMNAVDVSYAPIPDTDTPEQVSALLDTLTRAKEAITHTLSAVTTRAEEMSKNGKPVPGYAVIPGVGNRKFRDEDEAVALASALGVDITKQVTLSPSQAEQKNLPRAIINTITITPSTAPRLIKHSASQLADKVFKNE